MPTDEIIEQEIQAKGLTAPRVTPADIEDEILSEHYFTGLQGAQSTVLSTPNNPQSALSLNLLTFCVIVLKNGFTVHGHSACASPENFDADIGCKVARSKAIEQIWPLLGFRLRDQLSK